MYAGFTVLHFAAMEGLSEVVELLIADHKFDVNIQTDEGMVMMTTF